MSNKSKKKKTKYKGQNTKSLINNVSGNYFNYDSSEEINKLEQLELAERNSKSYLETDYALAVETIEMHTEKLLGKVVFFAEEDDDADEGKAYDYFAKAEEQDEYYTNRWSHELNIYDDTDVLNRFDIIDEDSIHEDIVVNTDLPESNKADMTEQNAVPYKENYKSCIPYDYAMKLLERDKFSFLDSPMESDILYIFNGRYWEMLTKHMLQYAVYDMLTIEEKRETSKIKALCKDIVDFVYLECADRYYTNPFTEADFDAVKNHIVLDNGVFDVQARQFYRNGFDETLPYFSAVDAYFIEDDDLDSPAYDSLKYNAANGDPDSMDMIDYMLAYLCLPNMSGKVFFCMSYAKNSGKTLLGNFLTSLLPADKIKTIEPENLSGRFSMAGIDTKCLLTCLEMSTDNFNRSAVATIKRLTGERFIRSEAKFEAEKTARVRAKILLATNGKIEIPDKNDDAFYKRLRIIPFINSIPDDELDVNLLDKLRLERSAIITKCLLKLSNIIDPSGKIVFPESRLSAEMKESWRSEPRFESVFFDQMLEFTASESDFVFKKDLSERYKEFLANNDLMTNTVLSQNELVNRCKSYFPGIKTAKKRRPDTGGNPIACFVGLRWR